MPITDLSERQQALDVRHSYIVQAPAGSGKTGVLTLRILTLLTMVERPEDILAITFTKKAAAEMRLRVMEALALAASGKAPDNEYDRQFFQLGCAVLERDLKKNWGLQNNQNRLHLQTIDSFCSSVVRNRPLSSGLGVQFNVADDPDELYSEAARELLKSLDDEDELGQALRRVLGFLNNQYQKFEGLLSQMLAQRDHWLQDISELHTHIDELKSLLEQSLLNINKDARQQFFDLFSDDFVEELDALSTYAKNQLKLAGISHPLLDQTESSVQQYKLKLALFVTKAKVPTLRSRFDKRDGFPTGSGAEKKVSSEYKDRAKALVKRIENAGPSGLELLVEFLELPAESLDEHSWQMLQDLILIVRYAAAHLKLIFQHYKQVDFSEIALAALATLGEPDAPSDVALILDATINHILIDEFQDTSFVQIELLERLTAGWQAGDGRSLFLVGDPMQSIYAFRKADVGLFIRLWNQQTLGQIPLTPLLLTTNFRSSETVIDWINNAFQFCFPPRSDQRKGAVTYSASSAAKSSLQNDGVNINLFSIDSEPGAVNNAMVMGQRVEAEWIADRIEEIPLHQTIAVLVKGKSHVLHIASTFRQRGIAFQAVEIESLSESQVVSDLLALAKVLWSPSNKTAWFALLRGPWCGLTLLELEQLVAIDDLPWSALRKLVQMAEPPFESTTQQKLVHLYQCVSDAYEQRHRRDWSGSLFQVMLALGLPGSFEQEISLQIIDVFFGLLNRVDTIADVPDFTRLEKKLKDLFVPPDNFPDGVRTVQIMSMHKSKGLEFDVVFLPQLQRKSRADDKPLILIDKQTSLTSPNQELFVAPMDVDVSDKISVFNYLWKLSKQRRKNEACRLLYVAATRAKVRLFLTGMISHNQEGEVLKPDSNSLLAILWPYMDRIGVANIHPVKSVEQLKKKSYFRKPVGDFISALTKGSRLNDSSPGPRAPIETVNQEQEIYSCRREAGVLVHRILEQWAKTGVTPESSNQRLRWQQELLRMGVTGENLEYACDIASQAVEKLLQSKHARWICDTFHQKSYAELSVTHVDELRQIHHLVIDRTFVENGTRYIIDYKLSEPKSDSEVEMTHFLASESLQYRDQLSAYQKALNAIEPMPTITYLFFPLIDRLQEVSC